MAQREFSRIKEVIAPWGNVRDVLRSGADGHLVPVVIPKDRRGYGWLVLVVLALYFVGVAIFSGSLGGFAWFLALLFLVIAGVRLWRGSIVEIEQGTTGILARFGRFTKTLDPGRHWLFWPWQRVAFIVDTSTEIPYSAPVLSSPTRENVPLKSIEFFLKFRIIDPVLFVRHIAPGTSTSC